MQGEKQGDSGYTLSNLNYDLVSALYHYSQAVDNYKRYMQDAEKEGDQELVQLFRQIYDQHEQMARQLEQALAKRVQSGKFQ
jgi:rubrerythrin